MTIPEARAMLARRWNVRESDLNITSVIETITYRPAPAEQPVRESDRRVPRYE